MIHDGTVPDAHPRLPAPEKVCWCVSGNVWSTRWPLQSAGHRPRTQRAVSPVWKSFIKLLGSEKPLPHTHTKDFSRVQCGSGRAWASPCHTPRTSNVSRSVGPGMPQQVVVHGRAQVAHTRTRASRLWAFASRLLRTHVRSFSGRDAFVGGFLGLRHSTSA